MELVVMENQVIQIQDLIQDLIQELIQILIQLLKEKWKVLIIIVFVIFV